MFLDTSNMSIDLGTTNLRIGIRGEGIVFNEPFVLAVERESGRIAACRPTYKVPTHFSILGPIAANVDIEGERS